MINQVIIMGRLTADPELKHSTSDIPVCSFTLAVDGGYGDKKRTDFIDCVAWRNTAEFICKYFVKGQLMAIQGKIQTRNYEDKQGNKRKSTEVVTDEAHFCGSNAFRDSSDSRESVYTSQRSKAPQRPAQAPTSTTTSQSIDSDFYGLFNEEEDGETLPF